LRLPSWSLEETLVGHLENSPPVVPNRPAFRDQALICINLLSVTESAGQQLAYVYF
jgi:hypothetical protein